MECIKCGNDIQPGRLRALPGTQVCIGCSNTERVAGFRIITGKSTYSEMQIVSQKKFNELTRKQKRFGSSPGMGIMMESITKIRVPKDTD
jgi:hypothetical protein